MTISERLFSCLETKNLKAADLCKLLKIGTTQTSAWKKRNSDPPARYIPQICEFCGVSLSFMLTGEEAVEKNDSSEISVMYNSLPTEKQALIYNYTKGIYDCYKQEKRYLG